jgi:hypothetical protein
MRLNFTQTYILALVLLAFLGIYYVWILNTNATKGYEIRNLEIRQHELAFEESLLKIKIAEAESLSTITAQPKVVKMDTIDSPQYLVLKDINYTYKQ